MTMHQDHQDGTILSTGQINLVGVYHEEKMVGMFPMPVDDDALAQLREQFAMKLADLRQRKDEFAEGQQAILDNDRAMMQLMISAWLDHDPAKDQQAAIGLVNNAMMVLAMLIENNQLQAQRDWALCSDGGKLGVKTGNVRNGEVFETFEVPGNPLLTASGFAMFGSNN